MSISTTITKKYFDMKLEDLKESGYFIEFKEFKKFWIKQLDNFSSNNDELNEEIVFLVGSAPHRFKAVSIWQVHRSFISEKYQSVISTEFAYAIKCIPLTDAEAAQIVNKKLGKIGLQFADIHKIEADIHWLREKGLVKE